MLTTYLSIDIGGTNLKYALLDHSGNLISRNTVKTPHTLDEFLSTVKQTIEMNIRHHIKGIAFSVPGKVARQSGTVYYGGSLPFLDHLSLKQIFESQYHLPVSVENDGKSAALAEQWLGQLKNVENGAMIVLGTGVGGGIIINHQLLRGTHSQAGELSFMNLADHTSTSENLLGFSGSAVRMIEACAHQLGLADINDGYSVFEAIEAGDSRVLPIFEKYCATIATMMLNIQSVIDIQRFVIGGGISAQPLVVSGITNAFHKILTNLPLLGKQLQIPEILTAHFKSDANLYGALYNLLIELDVAA